MSEIYAKLLGRLLEQWQHKSSGIILSIGSIILTAMFFINDIYNRFNWWQYCVMAVVGIGAWIVWYFSTRPPRCPKNKAGIILAIHPEDSEDEKILNSDFVSPIDALASSHNIFIYKTTLKDDAIITNKATAIDFCKKRNALMIIWGQFKKRKVAGEEVRVMLFQALIRHAPIPNEISEKLGRTMTAFLPVRVKVKKDNEFRTLELLADQTGIASSYFIAVSLCLSGRKKEGARILDELLANLRRSTTPFYKRDDICKAISTQLTGAFLGLAFDEYTHWRVSHAPEYLVAMEKYLNEAKIRECTCDNYHILRAIHYFLSSRNVVGALEELKCVMDRSDFPIYFNYGFLFSYMANYSKALVYYRKASKNKRMPPPDFIRDIIKFIDDIIAIEPNNTRLDFALGLVYFFFTSDKEQGRIHLEKFIKFADKEGNAAPIFQVQKLLNPLPVVKKKSRRGRKK